MRLDKSTKAESKLLNILLLTVIIAKEVEDEPVDTEGAPENVEEMQGQTTTQ